MRKLVCACVHMRSCSVYIRFVLSVCIWYLARVEEAKACRLMCWYVA